MKALLKKPHLLYLVTIIVIGSFLRFYGINWDQGHHLHPDERAIVMFTTPLNFPNSIQQFMSESSPWNPHFFAYGNFPLYLLKATASLLANFDPLYLSYEKINLVGRAISATADIGILILLYLLTKKLFNQTIGLVAAFFYAISVFPIQTAHFYAVDTLLTFFVTLTLYQLVRFYEKSSIKNSMLLGVFFGFSLATKISAIPLIIAIIAAIAADFLLLFIKQPHKPRVWFPHVPRFLKRLIFDGITIAIATVITFSILQPYAIIDFQEFWRQNMEQRRMTYDAFTFPYTLQYVGKIPYWYELKNIFLWGQGPLLATLSFLGALYVTLFSIRNHLRVGRMDSSRVSVKWTQELIILIFFWTYFIIAGKFAVGWMRYMLPLYPLFALFAAVFFLRLLSFRAKPRSSGRSRGTSLNSFWFMRSLHALRLVGMTAIIILIMFWPLSFMNIYTKPNTRVLASEWIYQNIPPNKTIAREHWDDGMPIGGNIFYQTLDLPIYDMGNPTAERKVYQTIQEADYIVIASNRLYVPLQRISKNCQKWNLPPERCNHNANRYYKKLFNGELGYKKVAEFAAYPQLSIFTFQLSINDSSADESFTVYDHPKVIIFEKILF